MGKKSAPTPPPPPDPLEIARTDADFNRINQFTPFGDLIFSGPNKNVATLSFSPEIQQQFDLQNQIDQGLLTQAQGLLGQFDPSPIDISQFQQSGDIDQSKINFQGFSPEGLPPVGLPDLQTSISGFGPIQGQLPDTLDIQSALQGIGDLPAIPQNIERFRGDVEQAVFNRSRRLLDPVFEQQERNLRTRLANQGLPGTSQAALTDIRNFDDRRNRTFSDLADQSVIRGGQEASRALSDILRSRGQGFGEAVASGSFANQAAAQDFAQALGGGQFANQAQQQQFAQALGQGAFGNQAEQALFGAALANNQNLFGQQTTANQLNNQASAQNLGLQQTLLGNRNNANLGNFNLENQRNVDQFNQLASLLGLQQVQSPGLNSFFGPGQTDVLGANALSQQVAQNQFNAQLQQQQGMLGGLFGLGGAALMGAGAAGGFGPLFGGIGSLFGGGGGNTTGNTTGGYYPIN